VQRVAQGGDRRDASRVVAGLDIAVGEDGERDERGEEEGEGREECDAEDREHDGGWFGGSWWVTNEEGDGDE